MKPTFLKNTFNAFLGFVLPESCVACNTVLQTNENFICGACHSKLIRHPGGHPWQLEEVAAGNIDGSLSLYSFIEGTEIQKLLHSLKYEKMKSIGTLLGKEVGAEIVKTNNICFDFAVPVPLHRAKEKERSYNQSFYLCRGIAEVVGAAILEGALERTRFTETQTHLHRSERKKNVSGAFKLNSKFKDQIKGKNIILADDVITTGSTILECARVLRQGGAGIVFIASAAYAVLLEKHND